MRLGQSSARFCASLLAATAMLFLSRCASLPAGSQRDERDHAERFNRAIYKFNTGLDHAVLLPVARAYEKVTPRPIRSGVSKFFANLGYTKTIGNDLFQGHFLDFGSDIARFAVNTTIGIGGVFDPATRFGLEKHDRDFGQTLGLWGLPTGSFLMLPLLGPSDVRDAFGLVPDRFMSIQAQINDPAVDIGLSVGDKIDARARFLPYDHIIDASFDRYAMVRSIWFQRRDYKVHGGKEPTIPVDSPDVP